MQLRWKGATSTIYGRSSGISDRPPVVQHHGPRRGHGSEGKGSADHVRRRLGDKDGHPHQTSPHKQLVCETKHETIPGRCGRGGPLYASKWIRSLFLENGVRPIPHQHLSEHGGAHQGERAEHLCVERSQVPGCTLHSLGAYEPAGRSQRAERLPSPQRDQGAICSALGQHPQDPSERGAGCRLSYGLEAVPHLSKTGLTRLTAIEVRGLRLVLGLPQSVPQCLVYREAGLLPFRRHIQLVCSKYVFRCQTVDNSTIDEITATFRNPSQLQSYSSICDLVCDLVRSAGLDGVEVATRPMHPYPPWLLERAHVEVDMEGLKKDQNPLVLAVTSRLCLEEKYQHHLKIFTDGSVMEDGAAGAAFVIPEFNNLTHSYSLPAVSVFTAELLAISMALQHTSARYQSLPSPLLSAATPRRR